jgi:hypothetical protein
MKQGGQLRDCPLLADCSHSPMDMLHRSGDTGIGTGTGTAGEQQ